ncbi:MAG TPA: hypothetical protein VE546_16485 [Streptomyces sp.]|uniref:hypothetical protein n=1 Tax=Streptomyces sp. TaxID=1931 RepID=UPI002D513B87|nr:hypothetical protein [Streptomyces sp.]HZG05140.1 hypothetical protein [Streptomyces sp.]
MTAGSAVRVGALSPAGLQTAVVRAVAPPRCSAVTAPFADVHLRADPDTPRGMRWTGCADVLSGRRPLSVRRAGLRVARLLDRHPGCLVAVVPHTGGGCVAGVRGGRLLDVLPVAAGARLSAG